MVETSPQLWICRLRRIKRKSWQVKILCYFTVALSLKPALASSVSPASPLPLRYSCISQTLVHGHGHGQSALSFFFLRFPHNVLGPARDKLWLTLHLRAQFTHPQATSRLLWGWWGSSCLLLCSPPSEPQCELPAAHGGRWQGMDRGNQVAGTRCTLEIPFPKCSATGRWYRF